MNTSDHSMAEYIVAATAALYYAEVWLEKIQLAENRQTENREKTEKSITETTLFPDGLLGTIIQIFKYTLVAVQYSIINVWQHYTV